MTRLLFTACAATLLLTGCNKPAPAADAGEPAARSDSRGGRSADLNNDGKVTREEARAGQLRILERADANRDGKLSFEEIEALPERMAERMDRLDANGDREVTGAEMEKAADDRFQRRDKNGDGVLTGEETKFGRDREPGSRASTPL
jgi:hypothetical protein